MQTKAIELEIDVGSMMIDIIKKWAWDNGYTCNHPAYARKLFKPMGTNKDGFKRKPLFRCSLCGQTMTERELKIE